MSTVTGDLSRVRGVLRDLEESEQIVAAGEGLVDLSEASRRRLDEQDMYIPDIEVLRDIKSPPFL
jgi:hypothetical protein